MLALIDFPVPASGATPPPAHRSGHPSPRTVAGPRSAAALLREARAGIVEAQHEIDPAQRFATAYLAALRAAAAMLALRGRPHRGRARPASAWVLLAKLAPEMCEWADFFAACSARRAAIQAGSTRGVTQRSADDLVRSAAIFADLVGDEVAGRGSTASTQLSTHLPTNRPTHLPKPPHEPRTRAVT